VHPHDLGLELLVEDRPVRGRSGPRGVVGARSDRRARLGERAADRLDSELLAMLVDEVDQRWEGRSSSAAKKADALLRIAFARRSSRFSRSSSVSRARSSVVRPGALPASMRACYTQFRSESGTIPSCSPTRLHAALTLSFSGPSTRSSAKRIARSRSSSGYFLGAAMTSILRGLEASINPGAVH
jgi:hypothetical protein